MSVGRRVLHRARLSAARVGYAVLLPTVLLAAQCARQEPVTGAASAPAPAVPAQPAPARGVRFALRVPAGGTAPVFVQVTGTNHQPEWITVARGGQRVFLLPRCDVETCGGSRGVCGAAIPMVRDLTAGSRTIAFQWDGTTSVLDPSTRCQTRGAAPAGAYVARFCWGRGATFMRGAAAAGAGDRAGEVAAPVCREVPFVLPRDGEVGMDVPPG